MNETTNSISGSSPNTQNPSNTRDAPLDRPRTSLFVTVMETVSKLMIVYILYRMIFGGGLTNKKLEPKKPSDISLTATDILFPSDSGEMLDVSLKQPKRIPKANLHRCIFPKGTLLNLYVYLSEYEDFTPFENGGTQDNLV